MKTYLRNVVDNHHQHASTKTIRQSKNQIYKEKDYLLQLFVQLLSFNQRSKNILEIFRRSFSTLPQTTQNLQQKYDKRQLKTSQKPLKGITRKVIVSNTKTRQDCNVKSKTNILSIVVAEKRVFFTNVMHAKTISLSKKVYLRLIAGEIKKGRYYNTSISSNTKALLIARHFQVMFGK